MSMLRYAVSLVCASALCSAVRSSAEVSPIVSWPEALAATRAAICAKDVDGHVALRIGVSEACGGPTPSSVLERAVRQAVVQSGSLITSLRLDETLSALLGDPPRTDASLTQRAQEHVLGDSRVLAILAPRLRTALEEQGIAVLAWPSFASESPVARHVNWEDFRPFLQAFLWPDEQEPELVNGTPTGRWLYGYHVCLDLNGVEFLRKRDPVLERAAFVAAMDTAQVSEEADAVVETLARDPLFRQSVDPAARTWFLRGTFGREMLLRQRVRSAVCETLAKYAADLGVIVTDCDRTANGVAAGSR